MKKSDFWEHDLRIDNVTWLFGAAHGFDDDDFFEEVILEAGEPYMHASMSRFADLPEWAQDEDGFEEWLAQSNLTGFIVKAVTPKPTKFHDDGGYTSMHFGISSSTYLYVDRLEDAVPLAVEWRDVMMTKWRNEQLQDA